MFLMFKCIFGFLSAIVILCISAFGGGSGSSEGTKGDGGANV